MRFIPGGTALLCLAISFAGAPRLCRAHDLGPYENVTAVQETLTVAGRTRTVLYLKPTQPATTERVPAILLLEYLHGTPVDMADLTEAARLVRDHGIWLILPESTNGRWNYGLTAFSLVDDVGFLASVIDDAVARFPIDSHRIYMGGYSNGAQMTQRFACDHPEKIAAGAIISGSIHNTDARTCLPALATPMIIFHGTADGQINYNGNLLYRSSTATAQFWAGIAACSPTPTGTDLPDSTADGTTVHLDRYSGCTSNFLIDHYSITGGGHTWPGSLNFSAGLGLASQDVSAMPLLWQFFSQFSRP